jgi:NADH-quinone oxidoreductase subunit A
MDQYLPIVLLLVLGILFAAGSFVASTTLGPKRSTGAKEGPYESGIVSSNPSAARFPVRFYMVAMIFVIFDIEVIFLYPWAVMFHELGRFGLGEMAAFALVVFVSFAYLVSNGALDWGPGRRVASRGPGALGNAVEGRTLASSVKRVPRPEQLIDGPGARPLTQPTAAPVAVPAPVGVGVGLPAGPGTSLGPRPSA